MEDTIQLRQISSLAKVFLDDDPMRCPEISGTTALKGERVSWQILYTGSLQGKRLLPVSFSAEKDERLDLQISSVGNVPCLLPCRIDSCDDNYLRKTAGLYPDVLYPQAENRFALVPENCHSLFFTATVPADFKAGDYPIRLCFQIADKTIEKIFTIHVLDAELPPQDTVYTQWFHGDCIATYYNLEPLSEPHWAMIEKFIAMAAHTGINMLLTPIFTLPLDTEVGLERPTLQLLDVSWDGSDYHFGFEKLGRWIDLCQRHGIHRFEMCHLFTQWGTGCTPKIIVHTKNGPQKRFGWHQKADSPEYRAFLDACIPALTAFLKDKGVYENTFFHVSDEPNYEKHLEIYKTQRKMVAHLIPEEKLIEACSHPEFLEDGIIKKPVAITDSIDRFFQKGFTDIWAYTCCLPHDRNFSNRFIAMPSGRNRIIGFQLYAYDIGGFLHWGYNFYYSRLSKRPLNPFCETDAGEAFPSGDPFSVYPGKDGPLESLRSVVFYEGLQDIRACKLLETYIGRDGVLSLIGPIKFNEYPRSDEEIFAIRQRINDALEACIKGERI